MRPGGSGCYEIFSVRAHAGSLASGALVCPWPPWWLCGTVCTRNEAFIPSSVNLWMWEVTMWGVKDYGKRRKLGVQSGLVSRLLSKQGLGSPSHLSKEQNAFRRRHLVRWGFPE